MQRLMMHQFGNYVLQKAITVVVDPRLRTDILESIKLQSSSFAQTKHGPKVLQKLAKTYPHVFANDAAPLTVDARPFEKPTGGLKINKTSAKRTVVPNAGASSFNIHCAQFQFGGVPPCDGFVPSK